MSLRPDNTLISTTEMLLELISIPFRAVASAVGRLAANTALSQTAHQIAAISDEELRAKGLTRADLVSLAFRHDG